MKKLLVPKSLYTHAQGWAAVPILYNIRVLDGIACSTDMDVWVGAPCDLPDGLYHHAGLAIKQAFKSKYPISDFPAPPMMPTSERLGYCTLTKAHMAGLSYAARAMSREETRYYLNGICFDGEYALNDNKNGFSVIATDGHRLHSFFLNGEVKANVSSRFIVPRKAIVRILEAYNEQKPDHITIEFFEGLKFFCTVGDMTICGKLIDGTFPDWKKVFPDKVDENKTDFKPSEFANAQPTMKAIRIAEGKGGNLIYALIYDGEIVQTVTELDMPDFKKAVSMKVPYPCGFNVRYLTDLLPGTLYYPPKDNMPFRIVSDLNGLVVDSCIMGVRVKEFEERK